MEGKVDICMGTLSKAFGTEGGYVCGSHTLIEYLKNMTRSFIFSTSLSPVTMASAKRAVEYMRAKKIPIKGIIFNHFHPGNEMEEDNIKMCEYMTGLKVLACVKDESSELEIEPEKLLELYEGGI